jgi:hypothetical protein
MEKLLEDVNQNTPHINLEYIIEQIREILNDKNFI